MPGSATLGNNLVDELIPDVVDELRDDLHTDLGVRQFRVFTVRRAYPSLEIGAGPFNDTEIELTPQPLVEPYRTKQELEPCGIDEAGYVVLREISLTYTEAELTGGYNEHATLQSGEDWLIKLTDAHGQEISNQYWLIDVRPYPDRIQDIGWTMKLRRASGADGF